LVEAYQKNPESDGMTISPKNGNPPYKFPIINAPLLGSGPTVEFTVSLPKGQDLLGGFGIEVRRTYAGALEQNEALLNSGGIVISLNNRTKSPGYWPPDQKKAKAQEEKAKTEKVILDRMPGVFGNFRSRGN